MTIAVGIYLFPEVEVLDFAGPYEVFTTASRVFARSNAEAPPPFSVFTVARTEGLLRARAGLVIQPDFTFLDHPQIDLLIVPGGVVTAELSAPAVTRWIAAVAAGSRITASVCTGSFLLAQAGLLDGRQATSHWEDTAEMRSQFPSVHTLDARRWVDEGEVVSSAGISAGIDMSLHLVERLAGTDLALRTARQMDFDWNEGVDPAPSQAR
jgi:transcriptional regulator GlxA family with amidase domain